MSARGVRTECLGPREAFHDAMPCEFVCPDVHEYPGLRDCCHTCTYFIHGACIAPRGLSFFPRVMWRIAREA